MRQMFERASVPSGSYAAAMPALNSLVAGYALASRAVMAVTAALAC
jgi:hypothetical protein